MSHQTIAREAKATPIERIFEKVMGRKMTPEERSYFHLDTENAPAPMKSNNGSGAHRRNGLKLTRP